MRQPTQIYTIGHSDHTIEGLIDLLQRNAIQTVVDVRSQPYSRWTPQFNREVVARDLESAGIQYRYMGDRLGGRPADASLYEPGDEHPNYERLEATAAYQRGINELLALASAERVALMCSEGDFHNCHRHHLLAQTLLARGAEVQHILPDGSLAPAERIARQLTLF